MSSEVIPVFFPLLGGPTDDEVAKAEAVIAARFEALRVRDAAALVQCTSQVTTGKGCGAMHPVGHLEYIQTHWYVEPHGCTGGDYWREGEGQWVCPTCGHRNRLYASPAATALKPSFKAIRDEHDERS